MRDQYLVGRAMSYFCCCSSMLPTWELDALVSIVYWPAVRGSASIGEIISSVLRISLATLSTGVKDGKDIDWSFLSFLIKDASTLDKLGTNWGICYEDPKGS